MEAPDATDARFVGRFRQLDGAARDSTGVELDAEFNLFRDASAAPLLLRGGGSAAAKRKTKKKPQPQPRRMTDVPNIKLMSNSERGKYYRRRKKMYKEELEHDVAELREQVASLTVSRQVRHELALSATHTPLGSAARLVVEYCDQFAHGAPVRLAVDETNATATLVSKATATQSGFLRAVMESNVRFGEFAGIDLLLDQWERYSIYHSSIRWTLRSLEIVRTPDAPAFVTDDELERAPVVVSIRADLTVRFSRRTIEEVFPHLLGDEPFIQELLGLEVTYPCINHFHFNHYGKIEWYNPEVDFVSALMGALGSIEKVNRVMGHALVAKDHMIGEVEPELHPDANMASGDEDMETTAIHVVEDDEDDSVGKPAVVMVPDVVDNQDNANASSRSQMDLAFILS